jgi:5-methylthioribose kinase
MLELTTANAPDYLRARGWVGAGPVRVEALSGGVSNAVFRVETPDRLFVLKQSRPQLRTRDAWFSDLDRVFREQEVMRMLHPLLPVVVPAVLFADPENYAFAMSHAPPDARVWKEQLLAGEVDLGLGERVGRVLGRMHEATARNPALVEPFRDVTVFVQLRVDPFYCRVQERCPEVAAALAALIERMASTREALCHGDYSPKNILVHGRGFLLVDYETACYGDPTMDLGFFLSHLTLKAIRRHAERERYFELTRAFWRGYAAEARWRPLAELVERGIGHFAACLLARIDGTSPVDYLPEPKRDLVRRIACGLLLDPSRQWEEALGRVEEEILAAAGL